jgi:GTP 3',8-cyclase
MPREVFGRDFAFLPRGQLLTFEELTRVTLVFAGLGVRKVRLTGGEPLRRRDLDKLVAMLAGIDGIRDIALTTNGALLAGKPATLAAAGLRQVNAYSSHRDLQATRSYGNSIRTLLHRCSNDGSEPLPL